MTVSKFKKIMFIEQYNKQFENRFGTKKINKHTYFTQQQQ